MNTIVPKKLQVGDEIRIIAPSRSLSIIARDTREKAIDRIQKMGFTISFSEHCEEIDEFDSSSIPSRVSDLHDAFRDPQVKGILTAVGGFNSNQLLRYIDYDLIRNNPKILCGLSDITALQNAITTKTGIITYSGPHISLFGMVYGFEYTQKYFEKCVTQDQPYEVYPSKEWSDDAWYLDQENRTFIDNPGFISLNDGTMEGTIIGGHLRCMSSLQGTEYFPSLRDTILFLEEDEEIQAHHFDRGLQSLIHLPDFYGVRGIVIGRFKKDSHISDDTLRKIIKSKKELENIPIVANVDFSHTNPVLTFPIGGTAKISLKGNQINFQILKH